MRISKIIICLIFIFGFSNIYTQDIECFPSEIETLILDYINAIRAQPNKDTITKRFEIKKYIEAGRIPPYQQEMFEEELSKVTPLDPVFYDPDLSIISRKHAQYMIINGQSHTEESNKQFFTGYRFTDRLKKGNCQLKGIGENCYLKSYGPEHCMLAFLIDWGDGKGNMQTDRPHRQNLFNKRAVLVGNGCLPHDEFLSVTQIFAMGEANCNYVGGIVYTDINNNGVFDLGEGHGNVAIQCEDSEDAAITYPTGLYTLKTKKKNIQSVRFSFGSLQRQIKINSQNNTLKIDLKLSLTEEEQIYKDLEQQKSLKKLTEIDFNWLVIHFRFKNHILSDACKPLKNIEIAIFKELINDSVENLNLLVGTNYKLYEGEYFQSWLKGIAYVSNKKALYLGLKGCSDINKWQEYKLGINLNQFPYPEAKYYLGKLLDNADYEINNIKVQK